MKAKPLPICAGVAECLASDLPEIPKSLTSFGAAVAGKCLFLYGGHTGSAHSYSQEEQSDGFYRLDLANANARWEELPHGPKLQGLSLVADGHDVIRVGGFTAVNHKDDEPNLQSQSTVARFVASEGVWRSLPDLPEPRSSLAATVVDDDLVVVGGWSLQGHVSLVENNERDSAWHQTIWKLDLRNDQAVWLPLDAGASQVLFTPRRALSAVGMQDRLVVIGGMLQAGKPTNQVLIYDWDTHCWIEGPALPGDPMEGFGTAAAIINGEVVVNTISGYVHRLPGDGNQWETIAKVEPPRFFHQMVPCDEQELLLIGGVNMQAGKFRRVKRIRLLS